MSFSGAKTASVYLQGKILTVILTGFGFAVQEFLKKMHIFDKYTLHWDWISVFLLLSVGKNALVYGVVRFFGDHESCTDAEFFIASSIFLTSI